MFDEMNELLNAFAGFGQESGGDRGIFHHREDGTFALVACAEQTFHRDVAEAARRDIGDAQEADVVVRIQQGFEVSEDVADFAAVEEALAANQVIPDAGLAQCGFERARLDVGAKENGVLPPRDAVSLARVVD